MITGSALRARRVAMTNRQALVLACALAGGCSSRAAGVAAGDGKSAEDGVRAVSAAPTLVIDSVDGEVTQHEVDTFLGVVSATTIPTLQYTAGSQYPNGGH